MKGKLSFDRFDFTVACTQSFSLSLSVLLSFSFFLCCPRFFSPLNGLFFAVLLFCNSVGVVFSYIYRENKRKKRFSARFAPKNPFCRFTIHVHSTNLYKEFSISICVHFLFTLFRNLCLFHFTCTKIQSSTFKIMRLISNVRISFQFEHIVREILCGNQPGIVLLKPRSPRFDLKIFQICDCNTHPPHTFTYTTNQMCCFFYNEN